MDRLLSCAAGGDAYLRRLKSETGARIVGYTCTYAPEELIVAAGYHPARLYPGGENIGPADAWLQGFACAFARGCLDQGLRGRWEYLDGVLFPYTCDSLRAVAETWKVASRGGHPAGGSLPGGPAFIHFLNLPARLDGPAVQDYLVAELESLAGSLARFAGRPPLTAVDLDRAGAVLDETRDLLARLWAARRQDPPPLTGTEAAGVALAATIMDKVEFNALGRELLRCLERGEEGKAGGPNTPDRRPRLLLTGGPVDRLDLVRLIEEAGTVVVTDDLCTGTRYFAVPKTGQAQTGQMQGERAEDVARAIARLAERLLRRVPCPAKHPSEARIRHLLDLAATCAVQGVVMVNQKFCDPHAFDYPYIRQRLEEAGIPLLLLEVEPGGLPGGQIRTRLGAFAEMLEGGAA